MIVLTVVTSVIMLIPDWNGEQASTAADDIDRLLDVSIVLSSFVFSIVMVMLGYCDLALAGASPATSPTASRSTATPGSRSPGP